MSMESWVYQTPAGTADFAAAALPTVASGYASVDAALTALNASGPCAVFVPFTQDLGVHAYERASFGCVVNGADGTQVSEADYLVTQSMMDGVPGIKLERIGTALWASNGVASAMPGARANHKECKSVAYTGDGLLAARTGVDPVGISRAPASIEMFDVAEALGIIRVGCKGASAPTGFAFTGARWE